LGCRRWLVVKRHTVTHDVHSVVIARERAVP
jgi:sarcosine oxidase delta subunit